MFPNLTIREAAPADIPLILEFIRGIAVYEKLEHQFVATAESLQEELFGERPAAEVILVFADDATDSAAARESSASVPVAYAVFFHNFSTFLGRKGLYLEDIFVKPEFRRRGIGRVLLRHLAKLAVERGCGRFEWTVLDWNTPAIEFYQGLGADVLPDWRICRLTGDALLRVAGAI